MINLIVWSLLSPWDKKLELGNDSTSAVCSIRGKEGEEGGRQEKRGEGGKGRKS